MSLLVVGSMAFDAIETPFGKTDKIIGGAATYISLAASYFCPDIRIVSVVGDDFPQTFISDMQQRGCRTDGLQIRQGEKSFFWSGKYHLDMNSRDTLITELNVLADFDPVIPDSIQNPDYVMLGNLMPVVQRQVIERLHKRPKLIAMDTMNFWMDSAMDELLKTLSLVDLLIINDEEARQLSGSYSLVKGARKIMEMGPEYLVIKKGEHGALLFHQNKVFFAPALPLEDVFDPTGAGDTFAGGLMGYLAKSQYHNFGNLKRSIIYGSAMASFCVEKFGAEQLLHLDSSKIEGRVQEFVDLVQFDIELIA
ncbi:MAG: sugar kinase [Sphingobacteriales bacterium]|nr:MAG: sugar kinase [Sphingobacteriales bacterium]